MISKSSDGNFDISEFNYVGMGDEKNCVGVTFRVNKRVPITLVEIAKAIEDCYSKYDINKRKLAPEIYAVIILSDNRTYEFKVSWQMEFEDYLIEIARQIEL